MPFAAEGPPYDPSRVCGYPIITAPDPIFDFGSVKVMAGPKVFFCPLPQGHSGEHQDRPSYEGQIHPRELRMEYGQLLEYPVLWTGDRWLPMPKGNVTIEFGLNGNKVTSDETDDDETGAWDE